MTKVLMIDDSPTSRAIAGRLIGDLCDFGVASNGEEGLALLKTGTFDLLFLDLLMPGMDGLSVLSRIRDEDPSFPVVVITADIQDSTRRRLVEAGATAVVYKPLTREKLSGALAVALGGSQGGRS